VTFRTKNAPKYFLNCFRLSCVAVTVMSLQLQLAGPADPAEYAVDAVEPLSFPDPSTADGLLVVYDRECALEIRQSDDPDQDSGQLQMIRFKILTSGEDSKDAVVRLECSSEADLFFHYYHTIDHRGFTELQHRQKLMIAFADYANMLIRMCDSCIQEPHTHMAVMYLHPQGTARLDFVQNMEYKFVELLSLDFTRSSDELVRQHITYRYNALKRRIALLSSRLHELNEVVKLKHPSLLLQIQKPSPVGRRPAVALGSNSHASALTGYGPNLKRK